MNCFKLPFPAADGDDDSKPGSDDCPIPAFRRVKLSQHLQRGQGLSLNSEQARAKPVLQTEAAASPGRPKARRPHVKIHKSAGVPFSGLSAYLALQIHNRTNQIPLLLRAAILMSSPGGYDSAFWQLKHTQSFEQVKARSTSSAEGRLQHLSLDMILSTEAGPAAASPMTCLNAHSALQYPQNIGEICIAC